MLNIGISALRVVHDTEIGGQPDEQKVELAVVDEVVALVVEVTVDVGQQTADLLQRQGGFEHVNIDDPA